MTNIYHDIEINASAAEIYKMITTADGLNSWWTVASSSELKPGGQFRFYFSDLYDWQAKVILIETDKKLSLRMTEADEDWTGTELSFEIRAQDIGQSLLRFEHKNWRELNAHFRRTSYCWAIYLFKMKEILES